MSDPALALQGALIAAIKALGTAAGTRVYDSVPASATYPYVSLGPTQSVGNYADCYDGTETFQQIDVWSRAVGYPEVKTIASAIRDTINAGDFTIAGHTIDLVEIQDINYSRDPDGLTSRARISIRALTHPDS